MEPLENPPEGFRIESRPEGPLVTWSWNDGSAVIAFFFGFLLLGVASGWTYMTWSVDHPAVYVVGAVPALFGLFVAYIGALKQVERTEIDLARGRVQVRHLPLPFPGGNEIQVSEIESLEIREIYTRSSSRGGRSSGHRATSGGGFSRGSSSGSRGGHYSYDLVAHLPGGREQRVVGGFLAKAEAQWVEALLLQVQASEVRT